MTYPIVKSKNVIKDALRGNPLSHRSSFHGEFLGFSTGIKSSKPNTLNPFTITLFWNERSPVY